MPIHQREKCDVTYDCHQPAVDECRVAAAHPWYGVCAEHIALVSDSHWQMRSVIDPIRPTEDFTGDCWYHPDGECLGELCMTCIVVCPNYARHDCAEGKPIQVEICEAHKKTWKDPVYCGGCFDQLVFSDPIYKKKPDPIFVSGGGYARVSGNSISTTGTFTFTTPITITWGE